MLRDRLHGTHIDVIITDVPYGKRTAWRSSIPSHEVSLRPIWHLLEAMLPILTVKAMVAVAADKRQKIAHDGFQRIERFRVGKRQVALLEPTRFSAA
jgi:tRNA G10  N-methylase Trm11